jgi:hypothetical protein
LPAASITSHAAAAEEPAGRAAAERIGISGC